LAGAVMCHIGFGCFDYYGYYDYHL